MFNEKFEVFGIHIWLKDPDSETMLCKIVSKPEEKPFTTRAPPKVTYKTGYRNQQIITANKNRNNRNSFNLFLIILLILTNLISRRYFNL